MKRSVIVFLVAFLLFFLVATLFGFSTTGYATLFINQQNNLMNYKIDNTGNFVQCIDAEPDNDISKRGFCYTQLYRENDIYGLNSVDYCKSKKEVVDYYCSSSFLCVEIINECSEYSICQEGRCVKDLQPYKYFDIRRIGSTFRSFFK